MSRDMHSRLAHSKAMLSRAMRSRDTLRAIPAAMHSRAAHSLSLRHMPAPTIIRTMARQALHISSRTTNSPFAMICPPSTNTKLLYPPMIRAFSHKWSEYGQTSDG